MFRQKDWTFASNFSYHGLLGTQYECPNLVKLPVRDSEGAVTGEAYVMTVSVQPGAPLGGSITEYFPGDFNGTHFIPYDSATRLTDFAKDNYAAQYFYGVPDGEDAISIGWASNWQYTQQVPTGNLEGWRSAMTAPRANYLQKAARIGQTMINKLIDPAPVLAERLEATTFGNSSLTLDFSHIASNALYIEANVTNLNTTLITSDSTLNLTFSSPSSGEALRSGFFFGGDNPFWIDRGQVRGFDNIFFTDKFSAANIPHTDENNGLASWRMQALFDRSICEWFADGGVQAATVLFYPTQPLTVVSLASRALPPGATVSVAVWALKSAWAGYADEQGTVVGNVSAVVAGGGAGGAGARRDMIYEGSFTA